MANVQGLDLVIEISSDNGNSWKYIACETSSGFSMNRSMTSQQTKCDGGTPAVGLGALEWSFNFSGVMSSNPNPMTQLSYVEMAELCKNGTLIRARRMNPANDGSVLHQEGDCYVTDISDTAETDGVVTFDFTLTGTGEILFNDGSSS